MLQGKYDSALTEYKKWMDKSFGAQDLPTYRAAFLEDLAVFEQARIIPVERMAEVAAVRALLEKE